MKKSELVKAAKEINTIIEPPIDVKLLSTDELEAELLEASEAVSEEDGLSEATMDVLSQIQAKYADNEEEEEEDADEEEIDGDEETDDEDESDEGLDEEGEDGDEISEDEDVPDNIDIEEEEKEEEEIEVLPIPKKDKGKGKVKAEKPAKSDKPKKTRDEIFKGNKTATRIEFFMDLINEGRYSKKDLIELAAKQFPDATISALSTIIYDGTNPKYCRFPVLIYIDKEDGNIVKFTDIKCEKGSKITKEIVKHDGGSKSSKKKEAPAKTAPAKEAKAGKKAGKKK